MPSWPTGEIRSIAGLEKRGNRELSPPPPDSTMIASELINRPATAPNGVPGSAVAPRQRLGAACIDQGQ